MIRVLFLITMILLTGCASREIDLDSNIIDRLAIDEPVIDGKLLRISISAIEPTTTEECDFCDELLPPIFNQGLKKEGKPALLKTNFFSGNSHNPMKLRVSVVKAIVKRPSDNINNPTEGKLTLKYEIIPLGKPPISSTLVYSNYFSHSLLGPNARNNVLRGAIENNFLIYIRELRKSFNSSVGPLINCCDIESLNTERSVISYLAKSPFYLAEGLQTGLKTAVEIAGTETSGDGMVNAGYLLTPGYGLPTSSTTNYPSPSQPSYRQPNNDFSLTEETTKTTKVKYYTTPDSGFDNSLAVGACFNAETLYTLQERYREECRSRYGRGDSISRQCAEQSTAKSHNVWKSRYMRYVGQPCPVSKPKTSDQRVFEQ